MQWQLWQRQQARLPSYVAVVYFKTQHSANSADEVHDSWKAGGMRRYVCLLFFSGHVETSCLKRQALRQIVLSDMFHWLPNITLLPVLALNAVIFVLAIDRLRG